MMVERVRLLFGISVFWLALSMLFDGVNTLVLPFLLLRVTGETTKATTLGLLTFVGLLIGMLIQPIAGAWSDGLRPRWGRRGAIAIGLLLILAALAFFGFSRSLLTLFVGYILLQVAASIAQAAQQGFIPDLVPQQWRGTASGVKGLMDLGGALIGFVLLGQLLRGEQVGLALLAIAATLLAAFALTLVLAREPRYAAGPTLPRVSILEAFRLDLRRHRAFAWLVVSRFLFLLGTYAVGRFLLYFVADRLRLDPGRAAEQAGSLLGGLALLTVLGAAPAGWAADRIGRVQLMLVGSGLSALGTLLLIGAASAVQIFLFGGLMALGSAAFAGANWAFTADLAPPAEAARFFGLANIGTAGAAAAAGLFGPLIDWANDRTPGMGYTALFVAAALAFVASAVTVRRIRTGRAPSVDEAHDHMSAAV
jgi:MFS family permease